ncbi:MAG: DUF4340 domain-containing protein [Rhizomicrobium sp.]
MDLKQIFADPRRRNLAVLAAAALVSLLLALGALWQEARYGAPAAAPEQFFPGFAGEVRNAARIHVSSKLGTFDVVISPEKGWVVPSRGNYRASYELVQRTLVGLAALQTIEPKTARADWLHFIGLETPPQGDAILITVSDDKGHELASLITGKSEDIGDSTGATGLFIRRPGENQSWLARSVLDPRGALSDWLDKKVVDIDRARIREVDVDPAGSPSYVVARAKPEDADFTLTPVPAGKTVADAAAPDGVAAAITGFSFDDVAPARDIMDLSNPAAVARLVTKTFDGLKVTVNTQRRGADVWASVYAEADPAKPDAAKEAAAINARAAGWAYKLAPFKGQLFMTTLDSLLKAPEPPAAAPR